MKTARTLTFAAAALITSLQLGALAVAFSLAPAAAVTPYGQQSAISESSLAPIFVVASQTD